MAVQVLNIEAASSLMVAQTACRSRIQSLVLGSGSTLGVQMLPQIIVWRFELFYDVRCSTASSLEGHVAMSLVHVVDVVLVLHRLSVVLIFEDFCQDSFRAIWHA